MFRLVLSRLKRILRWINFSVIESFLVFYRLESDPFLGFVDYGLSDIFLSVTLVTIDVLRFESLK